MPSENAKPQVDLRDASAVIDVFTRATALLRQSPVRSASIVRLPPRGRLLATGDLHDNPVHLQKIIRLARLEAAPDHHVILHEMIHGERLINGLDLSHRMLARVAELVIRFPSQAHPLLANHELAQMTGRGVSKGAGNSVELFNDGLEFVFGDDSESVAESIRDFIRAMPLALIAGHGVLCAHSLPAPHMMKHFDASVIERDLKHEDYQPPHGAAHLMVWGRQHTPQQLDDLASAWKVNAFCLGHEHVETGFEAKPPRLILLNSDHDFGAVLPIDLTQPLDFEQAMMSVIPLNAI
jgi:hypothetical protein